MPARAALRVERHFGCNHDQAHNELRPLSEAERAGGNALIGPFTTATRVTTPKCAHSMCINAADPICGERAINECLCAALGSGAAPPSIFAKFSTHYRGA
jgi:hypothetical protein